MGSLRRAARNLLTTPGFTLTAVATLALGIGANTGIFSLVNQVLLNPPGLTEPDRLVAIRTRYLALQLPNIGISAPSIADVRGRRDAFAHAAILTQADFNYAGGELPERLVGAVVSHEWFDVVGVRPMLGRAFRPDEDQPETNRVVVLAHAAWQRLFGGDAAIVGRTLELNRQSYEVVGVMGPEFRFPAAADLWTPAGLPPSAYADGRFNERYFGVARLQPGVTLERANAAMDAATEAVRAAPATGSYATSSQWGLFAVPMVELVAGDLRTPLLVLFGAVGCVLLIACSNIAGLMLARGTARGRQVAVQLALGARPWRVIRDSLTESALLAAAGAGLGIVLASLGVDLVARLIPGGTDFGLTLRLDRPVLLLTIAVTALSALLFGAGPAWQAARLDPYPVLKAGRPAGTSADRRRVRALLVIGETALALVLLVGAGLFLRSFVRLQQDSPGFTPAGVVTASITLPSSAYPAPAERLAFQRALLARLDAVPGVASAALGGPVPFSGAGVSGSFAIEGREDGSGPGPHGRIRVVSPQWFATLGIPLRRGRVFSIDDGPDADPLVVIDEALARQYWPDRDPIGARIRRGNGPWTTVVGVVGQIRETSPAQDDGRGTYYFSSQQQPGPMLGLVLRTDVPADTVASAIRQAVLAIDPAQPVFGVRTLESMRGNALASPRLISRLLAGFALVALFLAALGLYGVISYSVSQRTQEIGVRMALGAGRPAVMRLVVGEGLRLAAVGLAIGAIAAAWLAPMLETQLFGVTPMDPATFAATGALLTVTALAAAYFPARRAMRIDPLRALRSE
jgi:predicted permease